MNRTEEEFLGWNEDEGGRFITPFSFIHAFSGWVMAAFFSYLGFSNGGGFIALNLVHALYESKDYYYMYYTDKGKPQTAYNNTLMNSAGDQVVTIIGALLFYYFQGTEIVTLNQLVVTTTAYLLISIVAWNIAWEFYRMG